MRSESDDCWRNVFQEYGAALERLSWAYEPDSERRRDLLQEIHLALWRSLERFNGQCSLRTWVYRVAHNVAVSRVTRKRRNAPTFLTLEEIEALPVSSDVEESADRKRVMARLLTLIQKLDLIDRQLILGYLEGLDAASISQITGLSEANVWTRIHRTKAILVRQFHSGGFHA